MSRQIIMAHTYKTGFPRVSGDEPNFKSVFIGALRFSPRERG